MLKRLTSPQSEFFFENAYETKGYHPGVAEKAVDIIERKSQQSPVKLNEMSTVPLL